MEHLEGKVSIVAALQARRRRFEVILVKFGGRAESYREVVELATELGVPLKTVAEEELTRMTHGSSHGGIVAVCSPLPRMTPTELLQRIDVLREPALLLLLEGVDDARNLGFVLRTAEAMGAQAVLVKKHLWDFDAVEVARPSSGAYERLPMVQFEDVALLDDLKRRGLRLLGCIANGRKTIYEADLRGPFMLAIGGEKRGLSGAVRNLCDRFVRIPTAGGATSLSMSHAAAIALAEARRQRLGGGTNPLDVPNE